MQFNVEESLCLLGRSVEVTLYDSKGILISCTILGKVLLENVQSVYSFVAHRGSLLHLKGHSS